MEKMTITEALSEVNLIKKKIEKKISLVTGNLMRATHLKDPFESQGGSIAANKAEVQAVGDLNVRLIKVRSAIAKANLENKITIGDATRSIHDWLVWKREVSEGEQKFYTEVHTRTKAQIDQIAKQPSIYKDEEGKTHLVEFVPNVEYPEFLKKAEVLGDTLEKLDGQLSLKNATIVVEI